VGVIIQLSICSNHIHKSSISLFILKLEISKIRKTTKTPKTALSPPPKKNKKKNQHTRTLDLKTVVFGVDSHRLGIGNRPFEGSGHMIIAHV